MSSDMNIIGKGKRVGELLAAHDYLHGQLIAFDGHEPGDHTREAHEHLNDQIRANVVELLELIGMAGMRGLFHVAMEMLDTQAHLGLPLDDEGNWIHYGDEASFAALVLDVEDTRKLIELLAVWGGKVPADHEQASQALQIGVTLD